MRSHVVAALLLSAAYADSVSAQGAGYNPYAGQEEYQSSTSGGDTSGSDEGSGSGPATQPGPGTSAGAAITSGGVGAGAAVAGLVLFDQYAETVATGFGLAAAVAAFVSLVALLVSALLLLRVVSAALSWCRRVFA